MLRCYTTCVATTTKNRRFASIILSSFETFKSTWQIAYVPKWILVCWRFVRSIFIIMIMLPTPTCYLLVRGIVRGVVTSAISSLKLIPTCFLVRVNVLVRNNYMVILNLGEFWPWWRWIRTKFLWVLRSSGSYNAWRCSISICLDLT